MTTHVRPIAQPLERFYTFRNRDEILAFLEQNPFLVPVLEEAPSKIAAYFPHNPLHLEFVEDPEEETLQRLALYIESRDSADDTMLPRFDREWWSQAAYQTRGKMVVDIWPVGDEDE